MTSVARICSVEGCERPHSSKDYCNAHYKRSLSGADMYAPIWDRSSKKHLPCTFEGCTRNQYCRGLCVGHYQRKRNGTDMGQPWMEFGVWDACSVEGCDRPHHTQGHCAAHHARVSRGQDVEPEIRTFEAKMQDTCAAPSCVREVKRGLTCTYHSNQAGKYGLSVQDYLDIVYSPCSICGEAEGICIDHDHSCCASGKSCGDCVRGGLCKSCNTGLGYFRDSAERLQSAISYLSSRV